MKKILYSMIFLLFFNLSANAYVDSQYTTTEQFLVNTGYSKEAARILEVQKKDVYAPIDEQKDKRTIYQKIYNYIDPVSGWGVDFPGHNMNFKNSNWQDL